LLEIALQPQFRDHTLLPLPALVRQTVADQAVIVRLAETGVILHRGQRLPELGDLLEALHFLVFQAVQLQGADLQGRSGALQNRFEQEGEGCNLDNLQQVPFRRATADRSQPEPQPLLTLVLVAELEMAGLVVQPADLGYNRLFVTEDDRNRHLAALLDGAQPLRLGLKWNRHPVLEGGNPDRVEELQIVDAGNHKSAPKNQKAAPPVFAGTAACSHLSLSHSISNSTHNIKVRSQYIFKSLMST